MAQAASPVSNNVNLDAACSQCGKTDGKIQRCAQCHFVRYCGQECQRKAWPMHRALCKIKVEERKEWDAIQAKTEIWHKNQPLQQLKQVFKSREALWTAFANESATSMPTLLEKFLHSKDRGIALDIGCGGGTLSIPFLQKGWKVEAYDQSQGALKCYELHAKGSIEKGMLKLHQADASDLALKEKFDLVIANDIFGYLNPEKLKSLLVTIHDVLEKNGILFGSFFIDLPSDRTTLQEMGGWALDDANSTNRVLESVGFKVTEKAIREDHRAIEFIAQK